MWKLLTGVMIEEMYGYLEQAKLLSEEQKIFRQRIRGTKDQMFIDKHLLKNCNKRCNNLSMALIDYKKNVWLCYA